METLSRLVSQLKVGDTVLLENGEQKIIKAIGPGIYDDSRFIDMGRDNGKEVWACLSRTEKVMVLLEPKKEV